MYIFVIINFEFTFEYLRVKITTNESKQYPHVVTATKFEYNIFKQEYNKRSALKSIEVIISLIERENK